MHVSATIAHEARCGNGVAAGFAGLRKGGFTLLEMLVVIVVMAMLMGVTFRLVKPSEHAKEISKTLETLNLASAAIAEYQAEYGIYPPVPDPVQEGKANDLTGGLALDGCGAVPGKSVAYMTPYSRSRKYWREIKKDNPERVFCFGLASYLIDRRDPTMTQAGGKGTGSFIQEIFEGANQGELDDVFGDDSWWYEHGKGYSRKRKGEVKNLYDDLAPGEKDLAFYRRIRSITGKIVSDKGFNSSTDRLKCYHYYTIRDAFTADGRDLIYICPPPYNSYALFSAGPDGKVVASDPLNPDAECPTCHQYHNKDNVYSTVNVK